MNWWILIGLYLALSLVVGLILGPILKNSSPPDE